MDPSASVQTPGERRPFLTTGRDASSRCLYPDDNVSYCPCRAQTFIKYRVRSNVFSLIYEYPSVGDNMLLGVNDLALARV